jgi:PAS domain-containing protein
MNIDITTAAKVIGSVGAFLVSIFTITYKLVKRHIDKQEERYLIGEKYRESMTDAHKEIKDILLIQVDKLTSVDAQMHQIQMFMDAQFEINPIALFICDSDGKCTHANEALVALFNSTQEEMKGFGWLSYIHPEDVPRVKENWTTTIKDKTRSVRDHYRIIDKDLYHRKNQLETLYSCNYKAIFKYATDESLKVAVGSVWEITAFESNDSVLKCIADTLADMKGTPTWEKIQEEIRNKKTQ